MALIYSRLGGPSSPWQTQKQSSIRSLQLGGPSSEIFFKNKNTDKHLVRYALLTVMMKHENSRLKMYLKAKRFIFFRIPFQLSGRLVDKCVPAGISQSAPANSKAARRRLNIDYQRSKNYFKIGHA